MALSANVDWVTQDTHGITKKAMVIKESSVLYNGSLCSLDTTEGEVKPFDGTQADELVGWHFGDSVTGNSTGARNHAMICSGGFVVRELAVTGLLNTTADYGASVYATDDGTYTVADPGSGQVVGKILADADRSTGKAVVQFRDLSQLTV